MTPEIFRGTTTGKTIDIMQSMFGDVDVAVSKLNVLHA